MHKIQDKSFVYGITFFASVFEAKENIVSAINYQQKEGKKHQ